MTRRHGHRLPAAAAVVAGLLLLLTAPSPAATLDQLHSAGRSSDPTGPLVAAVSLLCWGLVLWLALTVLLVAGGRAPGLLGRGSATLVRRIAPAAVRRTVEVALGLSLAGSVLGASSASAMAMPTPSATCAGPSSASVDGHPASGQEATPGSGNAPRRTAPAAAAAPAPPVDLDWPASRTEPDTAATPAGGATTSGAPAGGATAPTTAVVVQRGDTLWGLAERGLQEAGVRTPSDAQVAQAWPHWWAANRGVIGEDPDLILPGTPLSPPPHRATGAGPAPPASAAAG